MARYDLRREEQEDMMSFQILRASPPSSFTADPSDLGYRTGKNKSDGCLYPAMDGKGRWIPEDKSFGFGLNVPRTRHASEIIRTTVGWAGYARTVLVTE